MQAGKRTSVLAMRSMIVRFGPRPAESVFTSQVARSLASLAVAPASGSVVNPELSRDLVRTPSTKASSGSFEKTKVPVIDMAQWRQRNPLLRSAIAHQVATAASDFGFFFVRNHGISEDIIKVADEALREFFTLPAEEKQRIAADKSVALKTSRGYAGLRDEQLDTSATGRPDLKEVLDLGLPLGDSTQTYLGPNPWPRGMPHLQSATEPYLMACHRIGLELLMVLSRSLGLPEDSFEEVFDEPLVVQRLMCYPAKRSVSSDPSELGCGAHYDFGGLTLLRQSDAPGLQVQPPAVVSESSSKVEAAPYSTIEGTFYSDLQNYHANEWMDVVAEPDDLVVTFGEAMQRLTNGRVQATRHRVVHDGATKRHSMAVFVDPNPHREVAPLSSLVQGRPMYEPRIAGHKTVPLEASVREYLGFGEV